MSRTISSCNSMFPQPAAAAKALIALGVVAPMFATPAALAHHSAAQFDTSQEIEIEGVITRYDFKNPHVYMAIEVQAEDGSVYEQPVEAGASSVLLPLGLTSDSVSVGDRITITANPNRRGAGRIVLGRYAYLENGDELPLNISSRAVRRAEGDRAESIAGTWFAPREGFFGLLGGRGGWQLTDAAQAAFDAFDGTTQAAHASCIPVTAPTLMVYPVTTRVEVNEDTVVFDIDWMSSRRVVYTDGRSHPDDGERTLHGHSIGHWEGDTLVVDTVGFSDHREGIAFGIPSGAGKHLIERFSVSSDGRHLDYDVFLEDPDALLAPVRHSAQWEYRPGLEPSGLECDLEVAQRFLEEAAD